jgi:hypothetical protein
MQTARMPNDLPLARIDCSTYVLVLQAVIPYFKGSDSFGSNIPGIIRRRPPRACENIAK